MEDREGRQQRYLPPHRRIRIRWIEGFYGFREYRISRIRVSPHVAVRGESFRRATSLVGVLGRQVDFAAQDRPAHPHAVLYGVPSKSGITLGQAELVREVRAE